MADLVTSRRAAAVLTLTLNNPEKLNALSEAMLTQLSEQLWDADADPEIRVVVLEGAGRAFSAGNDIAPRKKEDGSGTRGRDRLDDDTWWLERQHRLRMTLWDMHKPVVAKIHGYCLAGATDLVLFADVVIAADDCLIGFPPVRSQGSPTAHMWTYLVGPQWAKRLLLTGDLLTGSGAAKLGLVLKSVPSSCLDDEVQGLAQRMALIDDDLLSANKRIVNLAMEFMGARSVQRLAVEADARAHTSKSAIKFRQSVLEEGLRSTLAQRDGPFGSRPVVIDGPEFGPDGDRSSGHSDSGT